VHFVFTVSWETNHFFATSRVVCTQHNQVHLRFHRTVFYSHLKSTVGNILTKITDFCINLDIDVSPVDITSRVHTHSFVPSHTQTPESRESSITRQKQGECPDMHQVQGQ
jgi:hypothetical protein